jgi:cysteine desulfurase
LEELLSSDNGKTLVSIQAANNETGVLQPLAEIAALAHKHGALFHTDAVQIAGRVKFRSSVADMMTLSAHKLGGIAGAGALIVREGINLAPLYGGGRQETGRRPGTEPLAAIAAFGAVASEAKMHLDLVDQGTRRRDAMEERLLAAVPGLKVFGASAPRLPQTSCIGLPGTLAETQVIALDLAGIAVSAGAACSSGKVRASHVLTAMGASDDEARCAIRVSFGTATSDDELHQFTDVWAAQLVRSRERVRA